MRLKKRTYLYYHAGATTEPEDCQIIRELLHFEIGKIITRHRDGRTDKMYEVCQSGTEIDETRRTLSQSYFLYPVGTLLERRTSRAI